MLTPELAAYLETLARDIAADKGFTLLSFEVGDRDHVSCFVSAPPKLSVTDIVKYLKGITGYWLLDKHPELREQLRKGQLWNHSYYCETIGAVSEETVRNYIEKQATSY